MIQESATQTLSKPSEPASDSQSIATKGWEWLRNFYVGAKLDGEDVPLDETLQGISEQSIEQWTKISEAHRLHVEGQAKIYIACYLVFIGINGALLTGILQGPCSPQLLLAVVGIVTCLIYLPYVSKQHRIRNDLLRERNACCKAIGVTPPSPDIILLQGITSGTMAFATAVLVIWISFRIWS